MVHLKPIFQATSQANGLIKPDASNPFVQNGKCTQIMKNILFAFWN